MLLTIATCKAPSSNAVVAALATYPANAIEDAVDLHTDMPWHDCVAVVDADYDLIRLAEAKAATGGR